MYIQIFIIGLLVYLNKWQFHINHIEKMNKLKLTQNNSIVNVEIKNDIPIFIDMLIQVI